MAKTFSLSVDLSRVMDSIMLLPCERRRGKAGPKL